MRKSPVELVLEDLDLYLARRRVRLSWGARAVFREAEVLASQYMVYPYNEAFLAALIERLAPLQQALVGGPSAVPGVVEFIEAHIQSDDPAQSPYVERAPYSVRDHRTGAPRPRNVDLAIEVALENGRREILASDVLEAVLRSHDEVFPAEENTTWTDKRLHTEHNTLAHIVGEYIPELDVSFDAARLAVAADPLVDVALDPFASAPPEIHSGLRQFLDDHPAFERNCFLMMSFNPSPFHGRILEAARVALRQEGFNPLRADDRVYSDQLLSNIRIYLHGCAFGVAIFERIESNDFNPNVSLEVGYYLGMGRPVCLLKERTLPRLPSDLAGTLYREFDLQRPEETIASEITRWLQDKRLVAPRTSTGVAHKGRSRTTGRKAKS